MRYKPALNYIKTDLFLIELFWEWTIEGKQCQQPYMCKHTRHYIAKSAVRQHKKML